MGRRRIVVGMLATLIALPLVAVLAGQAGAFEGRAPTDLGLRADGRLQPPSATPNSVSSQARLWDGHPRREAAQIDPLPFAPGGAAASIERLRGLLATRADARIVEARADYLRVEFRTRWLGFVDDAEFWADPAAGAVQMRSASRLGASDLGLNRARLEALRADWAGGAVRQP